MNPLRIALAQFQVRLGRPDENLDNAIQYIEHAALQGAVVILLPEIWTSGYDLERAAFYADMNARLLPELSHAAQQHRIWIGGSYITRQGSSFFNTFQLISPVGDLLPPYHKTHLFRLLGEEHTFTAGSEPVTVNTTWGLTGQAVCYDLRFPELLRAYGRAGAALTLVSAEWGAPRREHWRVMLRSRAIENQMFIAATNTCGRIGEVEYAGHSAVVDPWGDVLVEAGDGEDLYLAEIDFERLDEAKSRLSSWEDDRPALYRQWLGEKNRN